MRHGHKQIHGATEGGEHTDSKMTSQRVVNRVGWRLTEVLRYGGLSWESSENGIPGRRGIF